MIDIGFEKQAVVPLYIRFLLVQAQRGVSNFSGRLFALVKPVGKRVVVWKDRES